MIYNFQPEIAIMNLLGISNKMLRRSLILFIFSLVFIGSCVGILFGILCSSFIVTKITKTANSIFLIFKNFPYKTMAVSMLVYFILIILMLVPIFIYMKKFTPNYIIQASNARMLNKGKKYKKHLFSYKTKGFIRKIAKDNIASNKISFVFTCIGIAFSIFILVIGFFFLKLNLQVFGHDTHMDYKVTFQSEEEITDLMIEERNSIYSQLIKRADLCNIYPVYTRTNVVDLERKNLNTQYIRYLEEKVTTNLTLEFGNQKNIPLLVAILGHNEQQLQELYSVNGLDENAILQDNEVIVLNKTIPYRGGQGFSLNFETNDLLDLHLQNYDGETIRSNFKIKSIVDKLNIYPNGIYNMVCLIINENTYKDWCEINVPNEFYIKILTNKYEDIGKIKELLIGKKFLTLSIPKEEEMLIIESNRILKTVLILFFMCIIISSGVSLASTLYMRIYTRETEYAMLQIIGMTTKQLKCIVYYEIFQIYIVGVFLAGILSYIGTYYMQVTLGEEIGMYMYNFPYKVYILSNILALIVLCFLSKPIFKRINNMNIIKVIKSVE